MRDLNRIDPFLEELGKKWKSMPDLRFFQFITSLCATVRPGFYLEDDEALAAIRAFDPTERYRTYANLLEIENRKYREDEDV